MDFIAADICSPPSRSPVDGSPRSVRTPSPPSSSGIRKHFPAVLQRVHREEGRVDRREADDIRSPDTSHNKHQVNEARGRDGSSVRTDHVDGPSSKRSERDRSDKDMSKSVKGSRKDGAFATVENDARSDSHSSEVQPASAQTSHPIATHTINQEQIRKGKSPRSSEDEHEATTVSSMSTLIPPETAMASMTALETHKGASSTDRAATQSKDQPEQASVMSTPPTEGAQADLILKGDPQAVVGGADTKTAVADVETHAASSGQETGRSRPQSDVLSQRESNLHSGQAPNGAGIIRPVNDSTQIADGVTPAGPAFSHSEGRAPSHSDKDNLELKAEALLLLKNPARSLNDDGEGESKVSAALLRGHQASFDVMKQLSELRAGQNNSQRDQAETELPQTAVAPHQVTSGQPTESIMSGAHGVAGSSLPPPPATPFASHAQPTMLGHDLADKSVQVMARSVVFDVAQPDLGHVNIRVAMANDVVHTHLSADRPEVGQFLINGQDRLQAAFQANGLDMGQFRVDIDRQGAGRSFHHGPSQEQGQTWDQGSQGMTWGQGQDRQDEPRTSLHGLLNVVA